MKRLPRVSFKYFRHLELLGFCRQMVKHAGSIDRVTQSEEYKALVAALEAFETALNQSNRVTGTQLKKADSDVNKAWTCLITQAHLMMNSRDEHLRTLAEAIYDKLYRRKNPTRLSFDEQYAVLQRHIEDIEAQSLDLLKPIHCDEWFDILREKFNHLMNLKKLYHESNANIGTGTVKSARHDVEFTYHDFCEFLMSLLRFEPSEELQSLFELWSEQIAAKKLSIKMRKASGKNDPDEDEDESEDDSVEAAEDEVVD